MEYETLKLLHQIAVSLFVLSMAISFIALIRIAISPGETSAALAALVRRWVTVPGGLVLTIAWILGIWMLIVSGLWQAPWMWAKVLVAFMVSGLHGAASKHTRLAAGGTPLAIKRPVVALIGLLVGAAIVGWLAMSKPF